MMKFIINLSIISMLLEIFPVITPRRHSDPSRYWEDERVGIRGKVCVPRPTGLRPGMCHNPSRTGRARRLGLRAGPVNVPH